MTFYQRAKNAYLFTESDYKNLNKIFPFLKSAYSFHNIRIFRSFSPYFSRLLLLIPDSYIPHTSSHTPKVRRRILLTVPKDPPSSLHLSLCFPPSFPFSCPSLLASVPCLWPTQGRKRPICLILFQKRLPVYRRIDEFPFKKRRAESAGKYPVTFCIRILYKLRSFGTRSAVFLSLRMNFLRILLFLDSLYLSSNASCTQAISSRSPSISQACGYLAAVFSKAARHFSAAASF